MESPQPLVPALLATARQLGIALPPALLPETQQYLTRLLEPRRHRFDGSAAGVLAPSFHYQELPATARLHYELVDWSSYPTYLSLFAADPSPFVEAAFKEPAALEEYIASLLADARYSFKRGGCDWLLRHRATGEPVGLLHLFDLSHERFGPGLPVPACSVGYALAEPFRRQGYGFEALSHLLIQAAAVFGRTEARAVSAAANGASQALLRKSGFRVLEKRPASKWRVAELLWTQELNDT